MTTPKTSWPTPTETTSPLATPDLPILDEPAPPNGGPTQTIEEEEAPPPNGGPSQS
jgi:hypothetical protein